MSENITSWKSLFLAFGTYIQSLLCLSREMQKWNSKSLECFVDKSSDPKLSQKYPMGQNYMVQLAYPIAQIIEMLSCDSWWSIMGTNFKLIYLVENRLANGLAVPLLNLAAHWREWLIVIEPVKMNGNQNLRPGQLLNAYWYLYLEPIGLGCSHECSSWFLESNIQ